MASIHNNLSVSTSESGIDVTNGLVLVRLALRDGGYAQEYHAVDKDGNFQLVLSSLHKNLIPSSEFRACASPMISGSRPHLFSISRDSLRMVFSDARVISQTEQSVVILLTGSAMGHQLKQQIELRDAESCVHITVEDNIENNAHPPLVEYLMSSYAFTPARWAVTHGSNIDYTWAPVLRPGDEQIIGDRAFHSPAAIIQHGHLAAALIPDPQVTKGEMQTALDLDIANGLLSSPLISYGFCGYEESGRYFTHDMTMARHLNTPYLKYGFDILLDADRKRKSMHKYVAIALWRHGREWRAESAGHNNYAISTADIYTDKTGTLRLALLEPDAWSAYGVYFMGDTALKKGAHALINALLSAPKYAGLFPTKFNSNKREWSGCNVAVDGAYYHSVECSRQGIWLLRWYTDIDHDQRIVNYCKDYGEFLVRIMRDDGSIPSFFDKYAHPLPTLLSSSQTAVSALFLARFGSITGDNRYTQAAQDAVKFVIKSNLYQDHTLIDTQNHLTTSIQDPHTGSLPQSGWSLLWSAIACLEIYESTADHKFLKQGIDILNDLSLFQSVWNGCGTIPFGMCARGNVDISADIELTAAFAECAMRYSRVSGEKLYFERGAAALKAAVNANNIRPLSAAHIGAIDAVIRRSFGAAFVHVGKKWAFPVNGAKIHSVSFDRSILGLSICDAQANTARIVFDGMRGRAYSVRINRHKFTCSADEMRAGIKIPSPQP
ncbi:hypothetical protein LLG46_13555 [bacterium]|nr:hypothetical protein [bacterium]